MILTVTPNPSLDRTYVTGPLHLGEVNRASTETVEASGKGVNVSRALHAAGTRTLAVLPAGGTEGEHLRLLLEADGLPYALVPVSAPTRTNTTVAEAGGRTTKVNSPGAPLRPAERDALVAMVARHAGSAGWAVFSGSLPPGSERDLLPRLLDAARGAGARTAVDTSGEALAVAAGCAVDLLAPNATELASLTGRPLPGSGPALVAAAVRAAAEVHARTGSALLVSLGADGAVFVSGDVALHGVAPPVTPVNTAGAGDALLAGWLHGEALGVLASAEDRLRLRSPGDTLGVLASARDRLRLRSPGDGDPAGRLARGVSWGTAACLMPGTAGDVAALADPGSVRVTGRETGTTGARTVAPP
ncbi:MAG: 1-phosphofructokinase [Micromonosporaceae bacterium]